MKHLLLSLLIFGFGISGSLGQTIKSLGYNTTNGQVVANTTNALTFTNDVSFNGVSVERISVGAITNILGVGDIAAADQVIGLRGQFGDIEIGGYGLYVDENNSLTINTALHFNNNTTAATTRTNLGLGWSALTNTNAATSLLGFTTNGQVVANTTNALRFSNNVSFNGSAFIDGNGIFWVTPTNGGLNLDEGWIKDNENNFVFNWGVATNLEVGRPIVFGTNAATTRTNLGLGAAWLTNTDVTNFRTDIGLGQYDQPIFNRVNFSQSSYINANGFYYDGSGMGGGISIGIISGQGVQSVSMGRFDNSFSVFSNSLSFNGSQSWGTNTTHVATTRANLGFSTNLNTLWTATNASNARSAVGLGETNSPQFENLFLTNASAGTTTNYILSLGSPTTGFTGVGGPVGAVNFRMGGTALWSASSTGLEFPAGARVRNTLDIQYGGGALGVISFGGVDSNTGRAISRTNLGLGATWLTNTDVNLFRESLDLGTNNAYFDKIKIFTASRGIISPPLTDDPEYGILYARETGDNIVLNIAPSGASGNYTLAFEERLGSWAKTTNSATARTNLGLGSGITTNRTFVSYNGTNYTTNTVTISNGIITGWTQ